MQEALPNYHAEYAAILPEQLYESIAPHTPAHALLLAILNDALWCVGMSGYAGRHRRRLARIAYEWFCSEDCSWPCAFLPLCDHLNLDAKTIRAYAVTHYLGQEPVPHIRHIPKGEI